MTSLNHYLIGNSVVMIGSCSRIAPLTQVGTPTDPGTVVFRRKKPDGSGHVYTFGVDGNVVKLANGIHACTVVVDEAGKEIWRYEGTAPCACAAEDIFEVERSMVI